MPKPEIHHIREVVPVPVEAVWLGVIRDGRATLKPVLFLGLLGDRLVPFCFEKGEIAVPPGFVTGDMSPDCLGLFCGDRMPALGEAENELRRRAALAPVESKEGV